MEIYKELFFALDSQIKAILSVWWLWGAPLSWWLFISAWLTYLQTLYKSNARWTVLEIHIPRAVTKGPKAMEQFFANLHGLQNSPANILDKYWDGEVELPTSFEIATFGGEIHYYIRVNAKTKNVVEALLYSQYANIEISEVRDYMERFPKSLKELYSQGMRLWGTELLLTKSDVYPIRTYVEFESADEFANLDPIAALLEFLRKVDRRENIMLQILVRSVESEWQKQGLAVLEKLKEQGSMRIAGEGGFTFPAIRTPGEVEVMKAIDRNIAKSGFSTLIRYIYIADQAAYSPTTVRRGVLSTFNQYASRNLNSFRHNYKVWTLIKWVYFPYFFPERRTIARRARILRNFRERKVPDETGMAKLLNSGAFTWNFSNRVFVLNTEELATIYHPPTEVVLTAPLLKRVESKNIGPPAGLPIFGDEDTEEISIP